MQSLTKPVVTEDQLTAISRKHLGDRYVSARELTDGWFNAAYMLTQPDGREYVLKIAPPPSVRLLRYETNILQAEVETMRLVSARTSLPIPKIEAYDRSGLEVESEYFLMDKLPGRAFNTVREGMTPAEHEAIYAQVGTMLREMHEIQNETFGLYNSATFGTWREAFRKMYEDLRQDGMDLEVDVPDGAFEAGEPLFASLDVVQTASFVHWDLWEGNVFVEDGVVTGLIDFERALWGDPLIEVNFYNNPKGTMEGYGVDLLAEPLAVERRKLYNLYFYLVMVIESKFRGFTAEHEAWPRGMLAELLGQMG